MPGSSWNYSGGGFTVMQMMAIDAAKEPFPKLMHDAVLAPIGMRDSSYDEPLPIWKPAYGYTVQRRRNSGTGGHIAIRRWPRRACGQRL